MKHNTYLWLCALALMTCLTSCELVGDIFEAGMWTAVILIVAVVALVIWLVNRFRGRR